MTTRGEGIVIESDGVARGIQGDVPSGLKGGYAIVQRQVLTLGINGDVTPAARCDVARNGQSAPTISQRKVTHGAAGI